MNTTAYLINRDVAIELYDIGHPAIPGEREYPLEFYRVIFEFVSVDNWEDVAGCLNDWRDRTTDAIAEHTHLQDWEYHDFSGANLVFFGPDQKHTMIGGFSIDVEIQGTSPL